MLSRIPFIITISIAFIVFSGCEIMPVTRFKPVMENPFPEITNVAVVPFINKTNNRNVNGTEIAELYAAELQKIPGFVVLPVRTVEERMRESGIISLSGAEDARLLTKILGVDAIVLGRVDHYSGYYPQQFGITTEWYTANRYFHPIPAGYALPWGTPREEEIPRKVVYEAERELARAQLKTQTPGDPQSEESYRRYLEYQRSERIRRERAARGITPPESEEQPPEQLLDPNDPNYEEPVPPEVKRFQKMQQNSVDAQLAYAYSGSPTVPKSMHNQKMDSRNAEAVKRQIAELLREELQESYDQPLPSPLPGGTEPSDWSDRPHDSETLKSNMHKTDKTQKTHKAYKPEVEELPSLSEITTSDTITTSDLESAPNPGADLSPVLAFGKHDRKKDMQNPTAIPPSNQQPIPQAVPQSIPQPVGTPNPLGQMNYPYYSQYPLPYYPQNYQQTPVWNANGFGNAANNPVENTPLFGFFLQQPEMIDPAADPDQADEEREPSRGGIFVALTPDGIPFAAYRIHPNTGRIESEIPLSELGIGNSTIPQAIPAIPDYYANMPGMVQPNGELALEPRAFPGLPEEWPDSRGLIPDGPKQEKSIPAEQSDAPIMSLSRHYSANDTELTQALADFDFHFRDDKRVGGWQMYLSDRKSFISFCCRMHIWEMLGARGGAGKAEKVKRTFKTWYGGQRPY